MTKPNSERDKGGGFSLLNGINYFEKPADKGGFVWSQRDKIADRVSEDKDIRTVTHM